MKEYELYYKYEYGINRVEGSLDVLSQAIYTGALGLLDLEKCRSSINELIDFLKIKIRFNSLNDQLNNTLICHKNKFEFGGHKFETLDEVEKAIKNKVFL